MNIFKDDNDDLNQESHISHDYYKLLSFLKSNETNVISIDRQIINGSPLYNGPVERLYIEDNSGISCWNYNDQAVNSIINTYDTSSSINNDAPPGLSQTTRVTNVEEVEDDLLE